MDRTTDRVPAREASPEASPAAMVEEAVEAFYDALAPEYDQMTGFERRFVQESPFFRYLLTSHAIRTALDAGAGTGFHSLLLARLGVTVTAVDISAEMLVRLEEHAREMGLSVTLMRSSFRDLPQWADGGVDAVFCLGNAFAHLLTPAERREAVRGFVRVLRPGGHLFIQVLNYDRIMATRERIQSVKDAAGATYVRFYDFLGEQIRFNLLVLKRGGGGVTPELRSVMVHPARSGEMAELLGSEGFAEVKAYGGITWEEFDPGASRDLVVHARLAAGKS